MKVVTSHKERYDCYLPELQEKESTGIQDYDGPSPINLMKPLFSQKICSYRLESYWSYEVCHGRYIRQYHEEREGTSFKITLKTINGVVLDLIRVNDGHYILIITIMAKIS